MIQLGWFRKSVLVVLIVALITTLPLPLLDRLFSPVSIYAASNGQSTAYSSPLSEALEMTNGLTNGLTDVLPPEMANGLSGMGMFGANGEPEGVLMDVGAIEEALNRAPTEPDSLANPISISRAQSAYQPGGAIDNTLLITFTVTNNRPPAVVPQVPESATITDSIAIMAEFDYSNDPNAMRNVMVVDELTANATYIASSPLPDQNGATNAWNLGDIAPLSSASFTMTLQVPASVSDFANLDTGATAWGTLQGRQVTAQSSPATLTPETINGEPIGDWLKWTVDADIYDEYMLQKAAEIGQAPSTLFAYVRSLGYESYSGSLRGTRGTIWSEAGNSLDQASLLIAMLRTSGIPARYRHGTLEPSLTQELILSMFPEPTRVIGHIPEGAVVSDPANDPQLLAESEDHWWVEAYLPTQGGWTDLDPSFPNAIIGERFVTDGNIATDGTDQIAEVPDNVRHKVTLKLKVEEYHVLNVGGDIPGLEHSYPLIHTFNTASLVGNPVTLGHLVNTTGAGGLVFSTIQHTYIPYFLVGDEFIEGNAYQDLLSNFPLGTHLHTAVWLIFETQDADGNVESYEREIVDRIGFEARQGGGNTAIEFPESNSPLIEQFDVYTTWFLPSSVPVDVLENVAGDVLSSIAQVNEDVLVLQGLDLEGDLSAAQEAELRSIIYRTQINMGDLLGHIGMNFAVLADQNLRTLEEGLLVNLYYDAPRIVTVGMKADIETGQMNFAADLRKTTSRTIPYPDQTMNAIYSVNLIKGFVESSLEGDVLSNTIGQPAATTARVFEAAAEQEIDLLWLDAAVSGDLDVLDISAQAQAHIAQALQEGKLILIPQQTVILDGVSTIGWWEMDPNTGEIIGVMENGLHNAIIGYFADIGGTASLIASFMIGFSGFTLAFVAEAMAEVNNFALNGGNLDLKAALERAQERFDELSKAATALSCALIWSGIGSGIDCGLGAAGLATDNAFDPFSLGGKLAREFLEKRLGIDPPLPDGLLASALPNTFQFMDSTVMVVTGNTSGTTLSASLTTPVTAISSSIGSTTFYASALSGMGFGGDGAAYGGVNYADDVAFQAQGANLMIGAPAGGVLQVGGEAVSVPNGVAIAGYGAEVSIAEASGTMDQVELGQSEADFFTLDLSEETSTTNPVTAITFQANISANFDDTYTMTVEAPDGWHVEVDETGLVTATPPLGAAEDDYTLLVVAQSGIYPDLFVSALHTVTVSAYEGMEMSVNPDLLITMPWGPSDPNALPGDTNNGQMQITGAAFTVDITNTSNVADEFTLDVAGLPEGWLVLSGEEGQSSTSLTLPAGGIGQVGLYISPTLTTLPPVGTEYPFTVDAVATDNADLSASDDESFIVPGIAFSQVAASPLELYSSPGSSTSFDLSVRNVGNVTGSFPLSITRPFSTTWTAQYNEPLSLEAGEANTQTVTLLTPDGELGDDYAVSVLSPSGAYTQTASVVVRLVGPHAKCAYETAQQVVILDNVALTAAVQKLANKMSSLENELAGADDVTARDEVVAATEEVIEQLGAYLTLPAIVELQDISQVMPTHTEAADLSNDLAALCDALSNLSLELQAVAEHGVSARFVPALNAALPNQTVPYTLTVTNQGTEQTDYTLSITSPLIAPINQTITLAPDEVANVPISLTPTELGFYGIEASVEAPIEPLIQANANAGLNVVDAFVQILQVRADPPFVETGTSSTTLSIDIANIANIYLPATASMEILAPDGSQQWSDEMPLDVRTGDSRTYTLRSVNTSGWESGTYTVTVDLLDNTNTLIPDGSGQTYLLVGQGLEAEVVAKPMLVAPGTVTVSTLITTTVHDDLLPAQVLEQAEAESNRLDVAASAPQITFALDESEASESAAPKEESNLSQSASSSEGTGDGQAFTATRMSGTTGIVRYEEDHPALLYNGVPFTDTVPSWNMSDYNWASGGHATWSETLSDTVSLTFTGSWVGLGLLTRANGGLAEVFIDGVSQGVIDTYSHDDDVVSYYYPLVAGTHTISMTVLGTSSANSSNEYIRIDYIDVWDGTEMPLGTFEHDSAPVSLSSNWGVGEDEMASDGTYIHSGVNAWFAFTGDSVTLHTFANDNSDRMHFYLDGTLLADVDLYASDLVTRTFSFDGLGAGPHVLQVSEHRGLARIDAFVTPGSAPFYEPPVRTGVVRYEEDDPALHYNGVPFEQTAESWNLADYNWASEGYAAWSETLSDTVSLTFTGSWVAVGLLTRANGGLAEIFIDGVSQGVIDTYSVDDDVLSLYYDGLASTTHTISVMVLASSNPDSSNEYVRVDYIDVWDGTQTPQGFFNEGDAPVYHSSDWNETSSTRVNGGTYIQDGSNVWFLFTGDEVTAVGVTDRNATTSAEVFIDGVSQGVVDLNYDFSRSPVPFHYSNLGDGPHVMRIANVARAGVDGFDTSENPFAGIPMVEWYDSEPLGGVINSPAAGDLDGDGTIEIAATSHEGHVYLYRGDGSDAGNGTPLIWSADVGGEADSPAMANLDGEAGSEIVFASPAGLYAYHHDGSQYWFTDTVRSTWRGVSIANMDDDPEPEIVATGEDCPCVVEHDGTLAWRYNLNYPLPPLLADLTGDGRLDILTASDDTLYLFDYAQTPPALAWQQTFSNTLDGRGTPAIADVDGLLPGGDEGPEIALVEDGFIHLVDADGSVIWSYATGEGAPGGVSIADTDGDGEVEILASAQVDGGRLYVLNADGSLLWHAPAQDSTSANSGSVLDLDGDGIWEIIWNGFEQGLTIYRGSDGEIIFNEPFINSSTRMDYPIIVDVDGDNVAEIVTGDDDGLYVVGYDSGWAPSRPLWNQYNYHITNIKNDFTVPEVEADSWTAHNTYRTQTPLEDPFAGYQVDLTHTIASSGMEVLPDTFSAPPDTPAPSYHWSYEQLSGSYTTSFDAVLPNMQPGEVRQISEGTVIAYQLSSGSNELTLPPLYVEAAHIIAIEPVSQTTTTGSRAIYDVTLSNPGTTPATYSLAVNGLSEGWANLPTTVNLSPESEITLSMTVTVPTVGELGEYDFAVTVDNGIGGQDQAGASLIVADLLDITLNPEADFVLAGEVVTYTVTITNAESVERTYALTHSGLEGNVVTLPDTVTIAANSAITTPLVIEAYANRDIYLFSVQATTIESQASSQDDAVLELLNDWQVTTALNPTEASGGPGTTVPYTLTVTNAGSLSDTYDLAIDLPAGWTASFNANGIEVTHLSLTPYVFNSANFTLLVTPPTSATPGSYDFTVTVQSRNNPESQATVAGTTIVTEYGVQVAISPANLTLAPTEIGSWDVTVTNTGTEDDSYLLIATGIVAGSAQFSPETVSVAAGQSETVQLSADILEFALERSYQFEVIARSTTHDFIENQDTGTIGFSGYEAVEVEWRPNTETVTDSLSAAYMLVITNTGNLATTYRLSATGSPKSKPPIELDQILYLPLITRSFGGNNNRSSAPTSSASASLQLEVDEVYIPPHMTAGILVTVHTNSDGTYSLEATANSISSSASGSDDAELTIGNVPTLDYKIMLPIMLK